MFIRRRRLIWLILVIGSSWFVISTYIVRSTDDKQTGQRSSRYNFNSQSRSKNSVRHGAAASTGLVPSNDFYYDDTGEEVIDIVGTKVTPRPTAVPQNLHDFKAVAATEYDRADSEIELPDTNVQDHFEKKADVWEVDTARESSDLHRRKGPTPNSQESTKMTPRGSDSVRQPPDQLLDEAKASVEEGWKKYGHNENVNRMISLHRVLPDVREQACRKLSYDEKLPDASVIIVFYDEAWRTLLRTVHSVIDKSPSRLLREIVLVNDGSTEVNMKQQLDDYLELLPVVRIVHLQERIGVVRARQRGAALAKAEVVVFLDSHCECTTGWLQPLLSRVAGNRTIVAVPVMDIIDDSTFQYKSFDTQSINIGGFDWSLQFIWIGISDREKQRRASDIAPVRSPTMSGGMYAMSRSWFNDLGGYDVGMDMWGAENLEMSFRVWMCGGSIEVLPCSHVGHVFRHRATHNFIGTSRKNYLRVAEVWLDDFKDLFYEKVGYKMSKKTAKTIYGDVTDRQQLRSKLQCRSFDWYLKNVYPELFIPSNALASGEVRSADQKYKDRHGAAGCLDSIVGINAFNHPVNVWPCHGQGGNQLWMLSAIGEIRRDDSCIDFSGLSGQNIVIYPCHGQRGNQEWQYLEDGSLQHHGTKLCMELSQNGTLVMSSCNGSSQQLWVWKRRNTAASIVLKEKSRSRLTTRAPSIKQRRVIAQELAADVY